MSYTFPEKFIRHNVIVPFLLLSVVIFTARFSRLRARYLF